MSKRRKYRLAMLDDHTLREVFHIRVSAFGAISVISISVLLMLGLLALLIVFTPIRNILPGYSASVRDQVVVESQRIDSLQEKIDLQNQYLDAVRHIVAGTISVDSVPRLDSLQIMKPTQLDEVQSENLDAFMAQYEQKEHDRLAVFDNSTNRTTYQAFRPVRGAVMTSAVPEMNQFATVIRTANNENILAVLRGTIISVERMMDNTYQVVLQSGSLMTIYRHVPRVLKNVGAKVERGELIGVTDGSHDLELEMWEAGEFVNPEEAIVW